MPPRSSLLSAVWWKGKTDNYSARVTVDGILTVLGTFPSKSAAAAAIEKFKIDGINPRKTPTSLMNGVSKKTKNNKWQAKARFEGGPLTCIGAWYVTEQEAGEAVSKYKKDGIIPRLRPPRSSQIKGVTKRKNKWAASAVYQGGPPTSVGTWYVTEEAAGAAARKYEQDGIKPDHKKGGVPQLSINICPGPKGCKTPCESTTVHHLWSFHDQKDALVGICCSKPCLDGRYQSPAFRETVKKYNRKRYSRQGMSIKWCPTRLGRWAVKCDEHTKYMADKDDAERWYNSEAARLGRPLIEGVPDAPVYSLNEILKRHLV